MTSRTYASPEAFKQALEQRLRTITMTGADLARTRQLLVFDRFLARIIAVLGEAVMLKGGYPDTQPTATAQRNSDGAVAVHAIWNGATDVARWLVTGGSRPRSLWPIGSGDWNGLDTAITLTTDTQDISVVAQNAEGHLIGRSAPVAISQ